MYLTIRSFFLGRAYFRITLNETVLGNILPEPVLQELVRSFFLPLPLPSSFLIKFANTCIANGFSYWVISPMCRIWFSPLEKLEWASILGSSTFQVTENSLILAKKYHLSWFSFIFTSVIVWSFGVLFIFYVYFWRAGDSSSLSNKVPITFYNRI